MSDVTQILSQIERGDPDAARQLLPLVYDELRRLAAAKLAHEKPGHTLQPTALVHEAWLRLVASGEDSARRDPGDPSASAASIEPIPRPEPQWSNRAHFFAAAAEAMRRILVDSARRKAARKRDGVRVYLEDSDFAVLAKPEEVVAVHDALDALAQEDSLAADLVKLHYFGGFSLNEAAELLGMSRATAYRLWTYARAWLRSALQD